MNKLIVIIIMTIFLSGCLSSGGGNKDQNSREKIEALENSGDIPKLERTETLVGKDSNNNDIRDDIEEYIQANYTKNTHRSAAMQTAKAMQSTLLVDTTNTIAVKEVNRNLSRANHCIYLQFDENGSKQPAQVSQELESITTNTKTRLLAYLAFSKALDGTSWAMPEGDTCE